MRSGHQTTQTTGAYGRLIDPSIDSALINRGGKSSEELTNRAESAHQAIPEMAVHPIGQTRAHPTERNDRASIELVDPHFIFEKPEQLGLREFERIGVGGKHSNLRTGLAKHPHSELDTLRYNNTRQERTPQSQTLEPD